MDSKKPSESLRVIPTPHPDEDGTLCGSVSLSPKEMTTRACLKIPPPNILPVIVIPGIMGSNLCATHSKAKGRTNKELKPGEPAWRPPNGSWEGLEEADAWEGRSPEVRQHILNPDTLDVDRSGPINLTSDRSYPLDVKQQRLNGWGEIHWDSYGQLLEALQRDLDTIYDVTGRKSAIANRWKVINQYDRREWGATNSGATAPLNETELKKLASYTKPVYAFGYNWLQSNGVSALALEKRIGEIIKYWKDRKQECHQVVLVTHSMGGLVARACARKIPGKIAGIVHSVMPALGAPVCYRRIACGTENWSPSNSVLGNVTADKFAEIAGRTPAETTPVMATAPGPLELLPTHRYPGPWLFASIHRTVGGEPVDYLRLPNGNPYDMYRNTRVWYRLIDPALADPGNRFDGNVLEHIHRAIKKAEVFHKNLDEWYHPNTYAIYCSDPDELSFGSVRWRAFRPGEFLGPGALETLPSAAQLPRGARSVNCRTGLKLVFYPSSQDAAGDGTVPEQSGRGPQGKVRQVFRTLGYPHQKAFGTSMLYLTLQLVARVVQEAE